MASINSAMGRRDLAMKSAQQKVLTVPNEDIPQEFLEEPEELAKSLEQVNQLRKKTQQEAQRISPISKQNVELLLNIGRVTEDVEVDGVTFSLRSLKGPEVKDIVAEVAKAENKVDGLFLDRNLTLSKAIYAIDGQALGLVLAGTPAEEIIPAMEDSVLDHLYAKYNKMISAKVKSFNSAEEIVEEIKK